MNYDTKTIHACDNIQALRRTDDNTIDLVYLDPPFNSGREYGSPTGEPDFDDKWGYDTDEGRSDQAELQFQRPDIDALISDLDGGVADEAYLRFMAIRIIEMRRILKPTGTMVLHCDDKMDSELRIVCNKIFGKSNFRNEIIWQRSKAKGNTSAGLTRSGDRLLVFSKTDRQYFRKVYAPYTEEYIKTAYCHDDNDGRGLYKKSDLTSPALRKNLVYEYDGYRPSDKGWRVCLEKMQQLDAEGRLYKPADKSQRMMRKNYLSEASGVALGDIWTDINMVQDPVYGTEKPLALLERIIDLYCPEDGIVFDPFCGCATACIAAEKKGREWVGADKGKNAILAICDRLEHINDDKEARRISRERKKRKDPIADERDRKRAYGVLANMGVTITHWEKSDLKTFKANPHEKVKIIDRTKPKDLPSKKERLGLLWAQSDGICALSGERVEIGDATEDHIIPRDRGGVTDIWNLQFASRAANSRKSNRPATTTHAR